MQMISWNEFSANHEAGHIVSALSLGRKFSVAFIAGRGLSFSGVEFLELGDDSENPVFIEREIVVHLAGIITENRCLEAQDLSDTDLSIDDLPITSPEGLLKGDFPETVKIDCKAIQHEVAKLYDKESQKNECIRLLWGITESILDRSEIKRAFAETVKTLLSKPGEKIPFTELEAVFTRNGGKIDIPTDRWCKHI